MIKEFVDRFMANKQTLENMFASKIPESYECLVKHVVSIIQTDDDNSIDPAKITHISTDDYQGIDLFIVGSKYYSGDWWFIKIAYGSCISCDALKSIQEPESISAQQVSDCMMLALHIVQNIKTLEGDPVND